MNIVKLVLLYTLRMVGERIKSEKYHKVKKL